MTLSNITDRGTLRGTIYRGAGSGTSDYTQLSNKPQINGNTLQGNQTGDDLDLIDKGSLEINEHILEGSMTGDDLGLINSSDLSFNVGYVGNILHNIKYKNNTYNAYAAPFSGASSDGNGTMGLVPAPLSSQEDYNKFLKGNGRWATPNGVRYTKIFDGKTALSNGLIVTLSPDLSDAQEIIFVTGVYAGGYDQFVYSSILKDELYINGYKWICGMSSASYFIRFNPSLIDNDHLVFNDYQKGGWSEQGYLYRIYKIH